MDWGWADMCEVCGEDEMVMVVVMVMSVVFGMLGDGVGIMLSLCGMKGKEVLYVRDRMVLCWEHVHRDRA
jgi:hypothetical protein